MLSFSYVFDPLFVGLWQCELFPMSSYLWLSFLTWHLRFLFEPTWNFNGRHFQFHRNLSYLNVSTICQNFVKYSDTKKHIIYDGKLSISEFRYANKLMYMKNGKGGWFCLKPLEKSLDICSFLPNIFKKMYLNLPSCKTRCKNSRLHLRPRDKELYDLGALSKNISSLL